MDRLEELAREIVRFPYVVLLPLLAALALGPLATRWLRRAGSRRSVALGEALDRATSRSVRLLILLIGLDLALSAMPLSRPIASAVGSALFTLAVLVGARLVVRVVRLLLHAYVEGIAGEGGARERAHREYLPLGSTVTMVAVGATAVILIAHHFGQDVTSLVAALGIGSLAIGLAAQQTLGNMIAGFVLLVDRPFRPGDRIRLQTGEVGEVVEIGIRSTRLLLDEKSLLTVPNAELVNTRVANLDRPSTTARGDVRVRLPWGRGEAGKGAVVERALALGSAIARAQPEVIDAPAPEAGIVGFIEADAEVSIRFHVAEFAQRRIVEERIRQLLVAQLSSTQARPLP